MVATSFTGDFVFNKVGGGQVEGQVGGRCGGQGGREAGGGTGGQVGGGHLDKCFGEGVRLCFRKLLGGE